MLKTYEITCRGTTLGAGIRAASPAWALETWKAALSPEAYSLHRTPAPRGVEEYESDPFEGIVAVEVTARSCERCGTDFQPRANAETICPYC